MKVTLLDRKQEKLVEDVSAPLKKFPYQSSDNGTSHENYDALRSLYHYKHDCHNYSNPLLKHLQLGVGSIGPISYFVHMGQLPKEEFVEQLVEGLVSGNSDIVFYPNRVPSLEV